MTWLQRYRVRHYLRNSIWVLPVLGMIAALVSARTLSWVEAGLSWKSDLEPSAAQVVLGTLAASMFTFIVFVCSALLLAVQLASSQLSPRIIGVVFRAPVIKASLTLFVFAFTLSLAALLRIRASAPPLAAPLAAYSCLVSLGVFLYLIDHVGRALRPSGALRAVAQLGREAIHSVYPMRAAEAPQTAAGSHDVLSKGPACTITNLRDGVFLAFDAQGLVLLAQRADCVVRILPQVGDFVAAGEPLFEVFGNNTRVSTGALRQSAALGTERTLEQDPAYAFRIMVDVASKALSPAINDPTTAVLAIDQIHHLLRLVCCRHLEEGRVRDGSGRLRLVYRTPDWEDYLHLAVTEIRQFGRESIQVVRRLRAMLEDLVRIAPEERAASLRQELSLLCKALERFFPDPEDRALADISDAQGVGGAVGQLETGERGPD